MNKVIEILNQELTPNDFIKAMMKVTPKDPTPRHKFRKLMKGLTSPRKIKFLRRMKTQYDLFKHYGNKTD